MSFYPHHQHAEQSAPFLDHRNIPTQALISYSNTLFDYLDQTYEPKGTQLLEDTKMVALWLLSAGGDEKTALLSMKKHLPWMISLELLAFSVETVFTDHGPSVTRQGFLTFQRSVIMRDPEEALDCFTNIHQSLGLWSQPFIRSQFLQLPDPQAAEIERRFLAHVIKKTDEVKSTDDSSNHSKIGNNDDDDFEMAVQRLEARERKNALANMRTEMADGQTARHAQQSDFMGVIGTGRCTHCRRQHCNCTYRV
ncbi:hypothetical protein BGZ83_011061 [Gryganskiella cystojenkinii]|nr:hypothetical protein BGZ83_011061 [Gryganskiella cystojenkinii]